MAHIREAAEPDIPRILELYRQLSLGSVNEDTPPDLDGSRAMFRDMDAQPGYHVLVAEEDGVVLGTITLVILPGFAHHNRRWSVIEYVVVDEAYRSRGIGQQLMDHAAQIAQEEGCYKIMLCSNKKRPDAHRFYKRIGYEQTHEAFHRYFS